MPYYRKRPKSSPGIVETIFDDFFGLLWTLFSLPFKFLEKKVMRRIWHAVIPSKGTECVTARGENVKSIAEKRIADFLNFKGIAYVYEKPLAVWIFKRIYPDFYLPDWDVYIEYYGLVDHPEIGARYRRERQYKQRCYERLGVRVIELFPEDFHDLEMRLKEKLAKFNPGR